MRACVLSVSSPYLCYAVMYLATQRMKRTSIHKAMSPMYVATNIIHILIINRSVINFLFMDISVVATLVFTTGGCPIPTCEQTAFLSCHIPCYLILRRLLFHCFFLFLFFFSSLSVRSCPPLVCFSRALDRR
jgi:hypothetical protein